MPALTIIESLTQDHQRLDRLLDRLITDPEIDGDVYREFKQGMLRHIRFEETILLPAARKANAGEPLTLAARLRLDHGAIAALLVPPPSIRILLALRVILNVHNCLEEGINGVYSLSARLLAEQSETLVADFMASPPVPLARNPNAERAMESAFRAVERAGFSRALLDW